MGHILYTLVCEPLSIFWDPCTTFLLAIVYYSTSRDLRGDLQHSRYHSTSRYQASELSSIHFFSRSPSIGKCAWKFPIFPWYYRIFPWRPARWSRDFAEWLIQWVTQLTYRKPANFLRPMFLSFCVLWFLQIVLFGRGQQAYKPFHPLKQKLIRSIIDFDQIIWHI